MGQEPEVFEIARKLRYDLTGLQANVTALLNALAALNLPMDTSEYVCPKCGADRKGPRALRDHLQNVHGEVPDAGPR